MDTLAFLNISMESFYNFTKQNKLELLSEQIKKKNDKKAQKTLNDVMLERTLCIDAQKKNGIKMF